MVINGFIIPKNSTEKLNNPIPCQRKSQRNFMQPDSEINNFLTLSLLNVRDWKWIKWFKLNKFNSIEINSTFTSTFTEKEFSDRIWNLIITFLEEFKIAFGLLNSMRIFLSRLRTRWTTINKKCYAPAGWFSLNSFICSLSLVVFFDILTW